MPEAKPKPRKPGRPKLPKGEAKGKVVGFRLSPDEIRTFTAAAKASKQSVSEWMRSTLNAAAEA